MWKKCYFSWLRLSSHTNYFSTWFTRQTFTLPSIAFITIYAAAFELAKRYFATLRKRWMTIILLSTTNSRSWKLNYGMCISKKFSIKSHLLRRFNYNTAYVNSWTGFDTQTSFAIHVMQLGVPLTVYSKFTHSSKAGQ